MELVEQDVPTVLGRIRIRVGGDGPVIVFWPSLLMDGTMWAAQAEHFAATHRVVLVDPPGHGGSEPLTRHRGLHPMTNSTCRNNSGSSHCSAARNAWRSSPRFGAV
jgi:pimeloyl-ACP methyl ester carboxylesterase